jgi:myxalamid-type polyketide synthase MxaE and MxaD
MAFKADQWRQCNPAITASPFFAEMTRRVESKPVAENRGAAKLSREALLATDRSRWEELIRNYLNALLARVLGFDELTLARLDASQRINRLGVDSLMALEMKSRIESDLRVVIPIVSFLRNATVASLTVSVLDQLQPIDPLPARSRAQAVGQQWEELSL